MAILTESFSVTGGDRRAAPLGVDADNRAIKFLPLDSSVSSEDTWTIGQQKVWLLIPGFTNDSDRLDKTLD